MRKLFLVLFCAAFLLSKPATAAPKAEPPYHLTTVSWVLSSGDNMRVDNRYVTLIGRVSKKEGDDALWFSDGTGLVRLDSEDFELPVGPKIVLGGRIDQAYFGFGHLEVDVRHWHYAGKP